MTKRLLIIIAVLLLAVNAWAGTAYYFDPTATSSTNVGTYANPFRTMAAVNAKVFATGDDVYFRAGTTFTASDSNDYLVVDWEGTSEDRVIIGAYYGEGQFGLNGLARPKIDGATIAPANTVYKGIIHINKMMDFITIQDIHGYRSGSYGITCSGGNYPDPINDSIIFDNIVGEKSYSGQGILLSRTKNSIIRNSYAIDNRYLSTRKGAAIEITANDRTDGSYDNWIHHNFCSGSNEGIGVYKRSRNALVEYNVSVNANNPTYYTGEGCHNSAFRFNAAYNTGGINRSWLYHIDIEAERQYCANPGPLLFYGNVGFGGLKGLAVTNTLQKLGGEWTSCAWRNVGFHHNSIFYISKEAMNPTVNAHGFYFTQNAYNTGWDVHFVNNIVALMGSTDAYLADQYSPVGVTFGKNLIDTASPGNIGATALVGNPNITATTFSPLADNLTWEQLWAMATPLLGNAVDAGTHLTTISATEGTSNNTMPVVETAHFFGSPNVVALGAEPMYIAVDSDNDGDIDWIDSITTVDHDGGVLTLGSSHTYTAGGKIWLARSSTQAFAGAAIDVGAIEFIGYPNTPPTISSVTPGTITLYADATTTANLSATITDPDGHTIQNISWKVNGTEISDEEDPGNYTFSTTPGEYTVTIDAQDQYGLAATQFSFVVTVVAATPSLGRIQIEDFDAGASGVAYYDATAGNSGGAYRSTDVDIWSGYGGYYVGDIRVGEWLNFTKTIPSTANYTFKFRHATPNSGKYFTIKQDGNSVATVNLSNTGGWSSWVETVTATANLTAGTRVLQLYFDTNLYNLDWMDIYPTSGGTPTTVEITSFQAVTTGVFKEGQTVTFLANLSNPGTITDDDSDGTKDFYALVETGATDAQAKFTDPAFGSSSQQIYFSFVVQAGMTTAGNGLEIKSLSLNGDGTNIDLTLPADVVLESINIDTSSPTIGALYWCDCETKEAITGAWNVSTLADVCACMKSNGDSLFFADGPLVNIYLPMVSPEVNFRYYSGIGTDTVALKYTTVPGDRGTNLGAAETSSLVHGATKLTDAGRNEITYTLPNVLSDWTYDLNLAVPKSFAYGAAWLVGSGWDADTINDLTLVPGDRLLIKD